MYIKQKKMSKKYLKKKSNTITNLFQKLSQH